ncbi:MAG: hypothetical protein IH793_11480 [Acidobacteria bacterium]|nr:hypothetical protein [Acidobacteriota bacterium]
MKILVLNCGSSSVKFQYIETDLERIDRNQDRLLARGQVERIGTHEAVVSCQADARAVRDVGVDILDHHAAIAKVLSLLQRVGALADPKQIEAVGHRVVHGGVFHSSQRITPEVLRKIEDASELAPLHNPHNLKGYHICTQLFPDRPQVAVFDTAFHQSMPTRAFLYALPYDYFRRPRIRIPLDSRTDRSRGFAFVTTESQADADTLIRQRTGHKYGHAILQCTKAVPRKRP